MSRWWMLALCAGALGCEGSQTDGVASNVDDGPNYRFGLHAEDLGQLYDALDVEGALDAWLEAHEGSFECSDYGDLCELVGWDEAYALTETSYRMALDGAEIGDIEAWFAPAVDEAATQWEATVGEQAERWRAHRTSFNTQGNQRVRVRGYNVRPGIGQGYAYAQCKYESRSNSRSPWVHRAANHKASIRSRRTTMGDVRPAIGDAIPSENGYTQNQGTGLLVTSGRNYHGTGPWDRWSWPEFHSRILTRACCQSFISGFDDNIWCTGSTEVD